MATEILQGGFLLLKSCTYSLPEYDIWTFSIFPLMISLCPLGRKTYLVVQIIHQLFLFSVCRFPLSEDNKQDFARAYITNISLILGLTQFSGSLTYSVDLTITVKVLQVRTDLPSEDYDWNFARDSPTKLFFPLGWHNSPTIPITQ